MASFDENGKYIKTNWKAGDKITATKLNKIEESIEAVNDNDISRHVEADTRLDAMEAQINTAKDEMTAQVNTAKSEITTQVNTAKSEITSQVDSAMNTIKAQVNQAKSDLEAMKNLGAENVGKILVVGSDGNVILMNMPDVNTSGDMVAVVDGNNNILLSGNLMDGTYVLKYENVDGTYTDVGTLVIGTIEPEPEPEPIEGNLFNLDAVQLNTKISGTSGSISAQNGAWLTDLIAINITDVSSLYVKNAMMRQDGTTAAPSPLVTFHDSNGTMLGCLRCNSSHVSYQEYVEIISENYTKIDFTTDILTSCSWYSDVKYMRVNGVENPDGTVISSKDDIADVIIKINEPIV